MGENAVQMDLFDGGEVEKWKGGKVLPTIPPFHHSTIPPFLPVVPEPGMVRVAPGRYAWVPKSAATPPESYVMCRWSRQADGTYAPVPVAGRYVRLDSKTATLLGFPMRAGAEARQPENAGGDAGHPKNGQPENRARPPENRARPPKNRGENDRERCRYDTILRLGRAGFVDLVRIAPNTILLDLDSWYRHLADCMDDPDRWEEGSPDRETYLRENLLGGLKRYEN